jgi:3-oxoadipate enol-lactonase/4-carboxymuconolactone decarboxylase
MTDEERKLQGMLVRREVLGDAHVDRAIAATTEFNRPFQDFIARYAWGEIWSRPELTRPTRSLVTLAILVALNREEEFKMHVRAAFRNGVSEAELRELLMHTAIYCGLPAANSGFSWAAQTMAAIAEEAK